THCLGRTQGAGAVAGIPAELLATAGQPCRDISARRRRPDQFREPAGPAGRRPAGELARTGVAAAGGQGGAGRRRVGAGGATARHALTRGKVDGPGAGAGWRGRKGRPALAVDHRWPAWAWTAGLRRVGRLVASTAPPEPLRRQSPQQLRRRFLQPSPMPSAGSGAAPARTLSSIRWPTLASMFFQYSNARSSTGLRTPPSRL